MKEPKIIRVPPGVGYFDGSFGKEHVKNGGKVAGNVSAELARQRRERQSKNAKIGALKKKIYGAKGLRSSIG